MKHSNPFSLGVAFMFTGCNAHEKTSIGTERSIPIQKLKGEWTGKCRSVVSWYNKDIFLRLIIKPNLNVEGNVGDAVLHNGKLKKNRRMLSRFFDLNSNDFRIDADLKGAIVKKEKIIRKEICIVFSMQNNRLTGGFTTSGTKFGGRSSMKMSAYNMELIKKIRF